MNAYGEAIDGQLREGFRPDVELHFFQISSNEPGAASDCRGAGGCFKAAM